MSTTNLIETTIQFVKATLAQAEGGHDWSHIERVYKNAVLIAASENCDLVIVQLGALLHDIADSKFHNGDETIGPKTACAFLEAQNVASATIDHVIAIGKYIGVLVAVKTYRVSVTHHIEPWHGHAFAITW